MTPSPAAQLNGFLAKYTPDIAKTAKAALARMRRRLPGAFELVYDNTYTLAIGFASTERTSSAVFSIAVFPRWVSLFFLQTGAHLHDPHGLLKGSGNQVRHIRLASAADLDTPAVQALMAEALALADPPIDSAATRRLIIKSIAKNQRPRRPAPKKGRK
jgi:Domain of unknown function (DU1801)